MNKIDFGSVIESNSEREFYEDTHKKILEFIDCNNKTTFWQIVRYVQGSDRRVLRLLNQMAIAGEIQLKGGHIFSNKPNKKPRFQDTICELCEGKIVPIKDRFKDIKEIMDSIYKRKPAPTFLYDQRPVSSKTTTQRAEYLLFRGDLIDKEIAVVGDDDLTSIAIGLVGGAKRIVVFEIDERLVRFIKDISKEYKLPIFAYKYDLIKEFPIEFSNKFDVFLADPTPNRDFFTMFLGVGLRLLKRGRGKIGYLSFFPSHQKIGIDFQRILTENGLIITDMIPKFTEYDYIEATYRKEDLNLLKDFDSHEERLSFYENLTRFETSIKTVKKPIKTFRSGRKLIGKATKRILKDIKKDPAFIAGDKEFVKSLAKSIRLKNE